MFSLIFFLTCILVTMGLAALAALSDLRSMTIDNSYSLVICGVFFTCYALLFLSGQTYLLAPIWAHLLSALIIFLITFALFAFGILGGADSKLATAIALWVGLKGLPAFLVFMTVLGALLSLVALALARWPIIANPAEGSWIDRAQSGGQDIPYGIAIFGGTIMAFSHLGYLDISRLSVFLT